MTLKLVIEVCLCSVSGITVTPNTQDEDQERLGPSSPFLDPEAASSDTEGDGACVASTADLIMQSVQDVTSKRRAQYFNIANSRGRVAKFCLFKTDYRLGEDIVASLDFTAGTVQCVQYSVRSAATQITLRFNRFSNCELKPHLPRES